MKRNIDIRLLLMQRNVRQWEIAERLGITGAAFSERLRKELPHSEKAKIIEIIDQIAEAR